MELVIGNCILVIFSKCKGKTVPLQAWIGPLGLQNFEATRICRQSAHESGKVVSPARRSPLRPQEIPLVVISVRV